MLVAKSLLASEVEYFGYIYHYMTSFCTLWYGIQLYFSSFVHIYVNMVDIGSFYSIACSFTVMSATVRLYGHL